MMLSNTRGSVLKVHNLREFFRESMDEAISNQNVSVSDQTSHYVVNLLTLFARSEEFYTDSDGRRSVAPLALMLSRALDSESEEERNLALQRLGDIALFVSGFFAHSISHRSVDRGYYVDMGGHAYDCLASSVRGTLRGRAMGHVFAELAHKFVDIVDVLNEMSEQAKVPTASEAMRLYDTWIKTGSRRAARLLKDMGIEPFPIGKRRH